MLSTLGRRIVDSSVLDVFDRFQRDFNEITRSLMGNGNATVWSPTGLAVWEDDQHVYVEAELPGVKPEDVDVTLEGGMLTIRGEKKETQQDKQATWHYRNRRYGQFVQQLQLPSSLDPAKITANLKDGVLRVQVEKRPEVKPRRIEVKAE